MVYDRSSEANDLILIGHMCNLRVEAKELSNFFKFLAKHNISSGMICTNYGSYYYVSLFLSTREYAEKVYDILLSWNP